MLSYPAFSASLLLCVFATQSHKHDCVIPRSKGPACKVLEARISNQRIRRELRDLSEERWNKVVRAIWIMKNTLMDDGLPLYGPLFKTYDYFVALHGVSIMDSRGDQAHFSNAFGTYHAAYILQFEESLIAVDPSVESLPYWEGTWTVTDNAKYFGSATGTGEEGQVIDGVFARFPVEKKFNISVFRTFIRTVPDAFNRYHGSPNGYLRGPANILTTSYVSRFGTSWKYPSDNLSFCVTNPPCWYGWGECILQYHHQAHKNLGGHPPADFEDITGSNDPLFFVVHNNLERNRLNWIAEHSVEKPVYYGFDYQFCQLNATNATEEGNKIGDLHPVGCPSSGIYLHESVSAQWPFSAEALGLGARPSITFRNKAEMTHADMFCHLGPTTAPYRYADPGQHVKR